MHRHVGHGKEVESSAHIEHIILCVEATYRSGGSSRVEQPHRGSRRSCAMVNTVQVTPIHTSHATFVYTTVDLLMATTDTAIGLLHGLSVIFGQTVPIFH